MIELRRALRSRAFGGLARWSWSWLVVAARLLTGDATAAAHQHLNAGAFGSQPGAALYFVNGDRYVDSSGYVVPLEKAETGTHAGLHRGSITLTALAATLDYGGPTFDHAALGSHLEVTIEELEGPAGGSLGFWEGSGEGEGTEQTFEVPVGIREGTFRIALSETDGSAGVDPYGHVHGRVFTATTAGLYTAGLRLLDTSANGPDGGPLHRESDLFRLQFQAGVSLAGIKVEAEEVRVFFGAAAGFTYQVEASPRLGPEAVWTGVGDAVRGDDHVREVRLPRVVDGAFFRLRRSAG
ncbi:MAG: hypothetical protein AB7J34_25090 [Limisphaerales bacterium]